MAQNTSPAPPRDNDTANWQVAEMDRFLDSHPEISEQLRKDPSLINDKKFVANHSELQEFLQQHPGIHEEFSENPNAFMHQERRFERHEDDDRIPRVGNRDITREELVNTDRFLDRHPEIAEQLRKDPSLIDNKEFLKNHPELSAFVQEHPGVREEFRENPNAFMRREDRFDDHEGRADNDNDNRMRRGGDRDISREELANMDRFMDHHPEIAEQLRKDPSLINDKRFVDNHPELREFVQEHPGVREEFRENPNAFMRHERQFDRAEDSHGFNDRDRDSDQRMRDRDRTEVTSFGQFLGGHSTMAQQLAKDPSLASNREFLETHPELRDYLKAHPNVQQQLTSNPQAFMSSPELTPSTTPDKSSTAKLKPKQPKQQ